MQFTKFKRGSIWYFSDNTKSQFSVGEQSFSRPVLIISNDKFNSYSPVVNILKLTSKNKNNIMHVNFNIEGNNKYHNNIKLNDTTFVLVEQIDTVSTNKLTEYLGCLSDDIMNLIEEKLYIQLNLNRYSKLAINKIKEFIDAYIDKSMEYKNNIIDAKDLIETIKLDLNSVLKARSNLIEKENVLEHKIENKSISKNTKGRHWTEKDKKFIIDNYKTNKPMLMQTYDKTSSQLSKLYYRFNKESKK